MKGDITIAHGHARYFEMAIHMAKSLQLTNPGLTTAIVTDQIEHPTLKKYFDYRIPTKQKAGERADS